MVDITVPAATTLRAISDSGDLRVRGIHGSVESETDSGEIEIASMARRPASSDSGVISIYLVAGGRGQFHSGEIEALKCGAALERSPAPFGGTSTSGQTVPAPVHAESDSGQVTVSSPKKAVTR